MISGHDFYRKTHVFPRPCASGLRAARTSCILRSRITGQQTHPHGAPQVAVSGLLAFSILQSLLHAPVLPRGGGSGTSQGW